MAKTLVEGVWLDLMQPLVAVVDMVRFNTFCLFEHFGDLNLFDIFRLDCSQVELYFIELLCCRRHLLELRLRRIRLIYHIEHSFLILVDRII